MTKPEPLFLFSLKVEIHLPNTKEVAEFEPVLLDGILIHLDDAHELTTNLYLEGHLDMVDRSKLTDAIDELYDTYTEEQ